MKIILVTLVICTATLGQSRDELKAKYGNAVSEVFIVRPGIAVTATYAATGQVAEFVITPQNTDLIRSMSSPGKALSYDLLKQIVDELVPMSKRGNLVQISSSLTCSPGCAGTEEDYERLTIY
jgi:hypothetical protein